MTSRATGASIPLKEATTSAPVNKSLLSRIKSPFGSKARSWTEFYVQPDDPHRQYAPGDVVTGSVILKVIKPVRITHLVVSLHGYVQVFKNANSPGDGYKAHYNVAASGKGKKQGGYFGNGFASLFEDEAVLCGEGRLGEGVYHFNFELGFPSSALPSSIDFERGTISYMITATMTRPTTISPTTSCDKKLYLVQRIDVATLREPKPRVITLERMARKSKMKDRTKTSHRLAAGHQIPDGTESLRTARVSELSGPVAESESPGSPAPSKISFDSHFSSAGGSGVNDGATSSKTSDSGTVNASQTSLKNKTITAVIELGKAGYLRGDNIKFVINIDHNKPVRNTYGVIVTLYRQARVDMHPALPVIGGKGDKVKNEDYYPKSRTGLGGLSLSSAGSSHLFRKDLSQSFAPLLVDPRTLTAEIKTAVRVPEEAFPTIDCVPGAMISFKYYVEVVVDVQGKLTGLDRHFPNSEMMSVPVGYGASPEMARAEDAGGSMFAVWGANFVDTEAIRRDKNVISSIFEVVIGTVDSDRRRVKTEAGAHHSVTAQANSHSGVAAERDSPELRTQMPSDGDYDPRYHSQAWDYNNYPYDPNYFYDEQYYEGYDYEDVNYDLYQYPSEPTQRGPFKIPDQVDDPALPEKERLRRAEARLLPSQPPFDGNPASGEPSSSAAQLPPTAPVLDDLSPYHDAPHPRYPPYPGSGPSSHPPYRSPGSSLPAPQYSSIPHPPIHQHHVTDDKEEVRRQRLLAEASAPVGGDDDGDDAAPSAAAGIDPSAPPLADELDSAPTAPGAEELFDDEREAYGFPPVSATADGARVSERGGLPRYEG